MGNPPSRTPPQALARTVARQELSPPLEGYDSIERMFRQLFPQTCGKIDSYLAIYSINHNYIATNVVQTTHAFLRQYDCILNTHAEIGRDISSRLNSEGHPGSQ